VQDPASSTTWIALFKPPAGRWTVTPRAGSDLARVQVADALPEVRVRARVRRGVLSWDAGRLPRDHKLTLVERAGRGQTKVLFDGRRARGRKRFRPLPVRGRHSIEVTVTRKGMPRDRFVATRFRAPAPPRLGRVSGLKRRGARLTWKRHAAAGSYAVAIEQNGSVVSTAATRRTRLRVPAGPITVTVVAMGLDGRAGPALRRTFRR
jgi:hypothetical protein